MPSTISLRTNSTYHTWKTETKYLENLKKQTDKIKSWLDDNNDKPSRGPKPAQSNITDNDSGKMKTSNRVIQGYKGVAMVDNKHQIIAAAEAFGGSTEYNLIMPMLDLTRHNFRVINKDKDVFSTKKLTADSGFHTNNNMKSLAEEQGDAYVADLHFRRCDPRFDDAGRYKERTTRERRRIDKSKKQFSPADFTFDSDLRFCICPAGKRMYRSGFTTLRGIKRAMFCGQWLLSCVCFVLSVYVILTKLRFAR